MNTFNTINTRMFSGRIAARMQMMSAEEAAAAGDAEAAAAVIAGPSGVGSIEQIEASAAEGKPVSKFMAKKLAAEGKTAKVVGTEKVAKVKKEKAPKVYKYADGKSGNHKGDVLVTCSKVNTAIKATFGADIDLTLNKDQGTWNIYWLGAVVTESNRLTGIAENKPKTSDHSVQEWIAIAAGLLGRSNYEFKAEIEKPVVEKAAKEPKAAKVAKVAATDTVTSAVDLTSEQAEQAAQAEL